MCEDKVVLPVEGVTASVPPQTSPIKPGWQRWNDYGIGCFLDDLVPELMGLPDDAGLYHFTMGGAREDAPLVTRAAYQHLDEPAR